MNPLRQFQLTARNHLEVVWWRTQCTHEYTLGSAHQGEHRDFRGLHGGLIGERILGSRAIARAAVYDLRSYHSWENLYGVLITYGGQLRGVTEFSVTRYCLIKNHLIIWQWAFR